MFAPINSLSFSLSHSFFVTQIFVETFEGEVFQKTVRDAITGVALSNNMITRRVESMGKDLREEIYEDFRSSLYTALAIDESTDITSEAQLLLWQVLGKFRCPPHFLSILREFHTDMSARVVQGGEMSKSFGCVLAPVSFNLFLVAMSFVTTSLLQMAFASSTGSMAACLISAVCEQRQK